MRLSLCDFILLKIPNFSENFYYMFFKMKLCIYRTGGAGAQGAAANGGMEPPKPSGPPSVIFFFA